MKRSISGVFSGAWLLAVITACGGTVTVSPSKGTPREQLQSNGPERCKAACVTVTACGLGGKSCDCACAPCPVGSTSCECAPCECTQEVSSPEKCESDCNESLQRILKDGSDCDAPMLALLNCLAVADCQSGGDVCSAEQSAMKGCMETRSGPPPAGAGVGSDPGSSSGSSGSSGGSVGGAPSAGFGFAGSAGMPAGSAVTCLMGGGSAGASGGAPPPPGTVVCQNQWDSCSDGHSYGVDCMQTTSAVMTCSCVFDGTAQGNFPATSCIGDPAQASAACGWNLR